MYSGGSIKNPHCSGCSRRNCSSCPFRSRQSAGNQQERNGRGLTVNEADVVYIYDGSFDGLLCCVYESVYSHELPFNIEPAFAADFSLLPQKLIETNKQKAKRVYDSIPVKICQEVLVLMEHVYFSCMQQKEIALLRFLLFAYCTGEKAFHMLGHPLLAPLLAAEKHLLGENHLLAGFLRFSDYGNVMAATITPKNFVLPYLSRHFVGRYRNEDFMIYDKNHQAAFIYENKQKQLIHLESVDFPAVPEAEEQYRALWRQFYKTIAIEARENPRCRMTHMPKRYWENMTEMQEYL